MEIQRASPELVSFTSSYLIEQMAPRLRAAGVTSRAAAITHLRAAGFGAPSVNALVDQALSAALEDPAPELGASVEDFEAPAVGYGR